MLFGGGERPTAAAVARLAAGNGGFSISHDPSAVERSPGRDRTSEAVWLELLVNGLTYDLSGLAPGSPSERPPQAHGYGLPDGFDGTALEAISLNVGPHLAGGAAMTPVVRSLAWLAAVLTELPRVTAVAWHPARCWCAPAQFREAVLGWIGGGAFPAFSLAALAPTPDGGMQSEGLALFTGQELRLEPELTSDRAVAAKIGLRLLHFLVENGRVEQPTAVTGPEGQSLRIAPSPNGRFVRVWKD